jgi:hypothetical protein
MRYADCLSCRSVRVRDRGAGLWGYWKKEFEKNMARFMWMLLFRRKACILKEDMRSLLLKGLK